MHLSLYKWYQANRREMPWRENPNPYYVWISEIMLQQTRVEAVRPFFDRFIETLPNVESLARVEEQELLKLWQGLGYYNRARNLKKAAETLSRDYGGKLPEDAETLEKLPGIGKYTAGAIASIAFGKKAPAVDGNVLRVLARMELYGEDIRKPASEKYFREKVRSLLETLPEGICPGDFNQALIELGALVCIGNGKPRCGICPLQQECKAFQEGRQGEFPYRSRDKERKAESLSVFLLYHRDSGKIALQQRPETGLLASFWEYPTAPGIMSLADAKKQLQHWGLQVENLEKIGNDIAIFTHREWHMDIFRATVSGRAEQFQWQYKNRIREAFPVANAYAACWKWLPESHEDISGSIFKIAESEEES